MSNPNVMRIAITLPVVLLIAPLAHTASQHRELDQRETPAREALPIDQAQTRSHEADRPKLPNSRPALRVDSNLVLVPVTVTDNRGRVVPDLRKADFIVTEEKLLQQVVSFSRDSAPISLGVVFDLSGSMENKIDKARAAVNEFLNRLEPGDEVFLVTFADKPELRLTFTSDASVIRTALWFAKPRGSTALLDAVAMAVYRMRDARNQRRILFLVSDGGDNHSRLNERELRRLVDEEDVQIHAIGIHDRPGAGEEMRGPWVLEDLANMTAGQHHMVKGIDELPELASRMSAALHDRYVLAYSPIPAGSSGSFRRIDVKIKQPTGAPRLSIYARRGYRMP